MSLQLELIIKSVSDRAQNISPNQVASPLGRPSGPLSCVVFPLQSHTFSDPGPSEQAGPPIDATFPGHVETGNHPCATIPSAPTGQRCCCYSRPGYKAPLSSSTLNPRHPPCHPTFILLFRAALHAFLCSGTTSCPAPVHLHRPVVRPSTRPEYPICSSSCTE